VAVTPRDSFGNPVPGLATERVAVRLSGRMELSLAPAAHAGDADGLFDCEDAVLCFAGAAVAAGSYVLRVLVDGTPVGGWTRPVQVRQGAEYAAGKRETPSHNLPPPPRGRG
jgi:hypothetical protein